QVGYLCRDIDDGYVGTDQPNLAHCHRQPAALEKGRKDRSVLLLNRAAAVEKAAKDVRKAAVLGEVGTERPGIACIPGRNLVVDDLQDFGFGTDIVGS